MAYYLYRRRGEITGYLQTNRTMPPPAERVSEEEFRRLGFFSAAPTTTQSVTETEQLRADVDYLAMEMGVEL